MFLAGQTPFHCCSERIQISCKLTHISRELSNTSYQITSVIHILNPILDFNWDIPFNASSEAFCASLPLSFSTPFSTFFPFLFPFPLTQSSVSIPSNLTNPESVQKPRTDGPVLIESLDDPRREGPVLKDSHGEEARIAGLRPRRCLVTPGGGLVEIVTPTGW